MMLEIEKLSAFYGKTKVLDNINLCFEKGKFYTVIGRNGSGKSTLVHCISGIKEYEGRIVCGGDDITKLSAADRAKRISLLPQQVLPAPFTVYELCSFGRNPHGDIRNSREKIASALEKANVSHLSEKRVDEISGGERQLSYFAMNICQDADTILLDEPTANLDMDYESKILSCAKEMCKSGKTVICVMHNLSQAVKYADEIVLLDKGRCIFSGSVKNCLDTNSIENNFGVRRHESEGQIFFSI